MSHSRYQLWRSGCPLAYRFRYVDEVRAEGGRAALLGSAVHAAVERFNVVRAAGLPARVDDVTWGPLERARAKEYVDEDFMRAVRAGLDAGFVAIVAAFTGAAEEYELTPALVRDGLRMCLTYLEMPFADPAHLPIDREVLALERSFDVALGDHHRLAGIFDRVDRVGNDVEVIDFKTGIRPPDPRQLALYRWAARQLWPYPRHERIRAAWWFLRTGGESAPAISSWIERDTVGDARLACMEIEEEVEFAARPEEHRCRGCDYRKTCSESAVKDKDGD